MSTQTLRQWLYTTLRDDSTATIGLRALLGKSASPYGIYRQWPPQSPQFPLVTYALTAMSESAGNLAVRDLYFTITAWGSNYEAVAERVRTLLRRKHPATSDYSVKMITFDQMVFEGHDEELNCDYRQDRYLVRAVKR